MAQQRNFRRLLEAQWDKRRFVCVGLDTKFSQIPEEIFEGVSGLSVTEKMNIFNLKVVGATAGVAAYKLNFAFYLEQGIAGIRALEQTVNFILERSPNAVIILDTKWADIDNTNIGYAVMAYNFLGVDCITLNPYLGGKALEPFLSDPNKGAFILCRTSNEGSGEFQDLELKDGSKLYEHVAKRVSQAWNKHGNIGLVVGATYPDELKRIREIAGDNTPILIPGVGAQGGDLELSAKYGQDSRGKGFLVNSSRGIIFSKIPGKNPQQAIGHAAIDLHQGISDALTG